MIPITKPEDKPNHGYDRDLYESRQLKEQALANHESRRGDVFLLARHALLNHLLKHGQVSADDIRDQIEIPEGVNPVCLGSVPGLFARGLVIRSCGYVESARREAHARPVSVWELLNREKAEQWLADNPLPEVEAISGEVVQ